MVTRKQTMGICISWSPALCLAPGRNPGPQFVFTGPGPQFVFTGPGLQFAFPSLTSDLYLLALAPNLYLPDLVYIIITSPGPKFCIYRPCLLNFCLYLRTWPRICITSVGPEFAFTLLLVVVAVVVVIVVVVISLELIIPIFVCRF